MNEQKLAQLICQTYEAAPHASAARLLQIEQAVASGASLCAVTTHQRRSRRLPWWMVGFIIVAGTAMAWWAINRHDTDAPAPLQDTVNELLLTPMNNGPSSSGQALNSQPQENTDAHEQEAVKNLHEIPPPPSSAQAHDEKSAVIYRREAY